MKERIGAWRRVDFEMPASRRSGREYIKYEHDKLPVSVVVFEEENGDWYVRGDIRGDHERTIANDPYGAKGPAMRAAYDWMRRHKHPSRMVTEDRDMREREYKRRDSMLSQ